MKKQIPRTHTHTLTRPHNAKRIKTWFSFSLPSLATSSLSSSHVFPIAFNLSFPLCLSSPLLFVSSTQLNGKLASLWRERNEQQLVHTHTHGRRVYLFCSPRPKVSSFPPSLLLLLLLLLFLMAVIRWRLFS